MNLEIIYQRPAPPDDAPLSAKRLFEWGSFVFYEFFLRGGQNAETRQIAFQIFDAYQTALANLDEREFVGKVTTFVDSLEIIREARGRDTAHFIRCSSLLQRSRRDHAVRY